MTKMFDWLKEHDLGLQYEEALHGVQTSIGFGYYENSIKPKHLRVGIDMSKADMLGLVCLLIDKGIFTEDEYREYIRLSANAEVKQREESNSHGGQEVSFR